MRNIFIGLIIIAFIAGGAWYYSNQRGQSDADAQDTPIQKWNVSINNWDFQGAYTGNPELEKRANDEIARLKKLIGSGTETEYSYYISIANQYDLLGDGENEYVYLKKALAIDDATTGLAWANVAVLFARLGDEKSARDAYARAVKAQAHPQYVTAYLDFLTQHFTDDTAAIEGAYEAAVLSVGEAPQLLEIRARWLEGQGRFQEAIDAWNKLKQLSPGSSSAADLEIKQLQSRL